MYEESEILELKRELTDDIIKEIIAFANTKGGKIMIGVNDDGEVVGVAEPKQVCETLSSKINASIKPSILGLISIYVVDEDNKQIVVTDVMRGTARPYYLANKGLKPTGVFIRLGNTSVPAGDNTIRELIRDTDGVKYEDMLSFNQELHFEYTKSFFKEKGVALENENIITLGMKNKDDMYTNLGLLLSDECEHTIKVAVFADDTKDRFLDRKEFGGSVFKQLSDAYDYINLNNKVSSTYKGINRIDHKAYDELGLREALLNAIVHRDYSFDGSIIVNIYADKIEFVSIGGLVAGINLDDIMIGISQTKNKKLANVFYRLQIIESYGTGIKKILSDYKDCIQKPKFTVSKGAFLLTLPNRNSIQGINEITLEREKLEKIIEKFRGTEILSRKELQEALGMKKTTSIEMIKFLIKAGILQQVGNGKNIKYMLK